MLLHVQCRRKRKCMPLSPLLSSLSFFPDFIFHLPHSPIFLSFLSFFFHFGSPLFFLHNSVLRSRFLPSLPLFSLFFSSTFSLGHPRVPFFFYLLFFFLSSIQFLSVLVLSVAHRSFPLHFVPVPVSLFAPSFN